MGRNRLHPQGRRRRPGGGRKRCPTRAGLARAVALECVELCLGAGIFPDGGATSADEHGLERASRRPRKVRSSTRWHERLPSEPLFQPPQPPPPPQKRRLDQEAGRPIVDEACVRVALRLLSGPDQARVGPMVQLFRARTRSVTVEVRRLARATAEVLGGALDLCCTADDGDADSAQDAGATPDLEILELFEEAAASSPAWSAAGRRTPAAATPSADLARRDPVTLLAAHGALRRLNAAVERVRKAYFQRRKQTSEEIGVLLGAGLQEELVADAGPLPPACRRACVEIPHWHCADCGAVVVDPMPYFRVDEGGRARDAARVCGAKCYAAWTQRSRDPTTK